MRELVGLHSRGTPAPGPALSPARPSPGSARPPPAPHPARVTHEKGVVTLDLKLNHGLAGD